MLAKLHISYALIEAANKKTMGTLEVNVEREVIVN